MILLDTGPLVALCDARDALNGAAARQLRRLASQSLVACLPVLTEACALLPYAVQRRRLRRFLTDFAVVPYRVEDEHALWLEVLDWLERHRDHEPDLTGFFEEHPSPLSHSHQPIWRGAGVPGLR